MKQQIEALIEKYQDHSEMLRAKNVGEEIGEARVEAWYEVYRKVIADLTNLLKDGEQQQPVAYKVKEYCYLDNRWWQFEEVIVVDGESNNWRGLEWFNSHPSLFEPLYELPEGYEIEKEDEDD